MRIIAMVCVLIAQHYQERSKPSHIKLLNIRPPQEGRQGKFLALLIAQQPHTYPVITTMPMTQLYHFFTTLQRHQSDKNSKYAVLRARFSRVFWETLLMLPHISGGPDAHDPQLPPGHLRSYILKVLGPMVAYLTDQHLHIF